ncbi:hypothetical protein E2562_028769 [Oryza meyeriana var. granulata]|uniref:Uncharacterized protein n=1 Tax=Oryza meyeriana var. granulata TaxID=110450 RepID=A0A6G1FD14_9ORYZ|nr:hypothetical protein E2562_028769 [Oryza meyeriana var. granulata]
MVYVEVLSSPSTSTAEGLVALVVSSPSPRQPITIMAQVPSEEEEEPREVEPQVSKELHADKEPLEVQEVQGAQEVQGVQETQEIQEVQEVQAVQEV